MIALALLAAARAATCLDYEAPELVLQADAVPVVESSGLALSRRRDGVWYTHDDSGGEAELFAFELDGAYEGSHAVPDVLPLDWEAMGAGPCPARLAEATGAEDCLYVGDVGDNFAARTSVSVYVLAEPSRDDPAWVLERWDLTWPGGPRDCEALLVHPLTGRVYLVSKSADGPAVVARVPEEPGGEEPVELEVVATLDPLDSGAADRSITGGDWDADGERVVLRTYGSVLVWSTDPCEPDAHWSRPADFAFAADDSGGEAVGFAADGGIVTTTEGSPMQVRLAACVGWEAAGEAACDTGPAPDTGGEVGAGAADGRCGCAGGAAALPGLPLFLLALGRRRDQRG